MFGKNMAYFHQNSVWFDFKFSEIYNLKGVPLSLDLFPVKDGLKTEKAT
jgi:hypothetical protein